MSASGGGDYAKLNKLLIIAALVYYLWPQLRQAFGSLGLQLPALPAGARGVQPLGLYGNPDPGAVVAPPGGGTTSSGVGAVGGVATTAIGALAGAGLGAGALLAATGIGAAAAIIAWGVIKQGWFRGGQEGVVVNPARDQFLAQFAPLDVLRDGRNPPGFYGLAWMLEQLAAGQGTGGAFAALTGAHTKAQLEAAVSTVQGLVASNSARFAQLWEYARRDPSAPQRAVSAAA